MNAKKIYSQALHDLDCNIITTEEFNKRTKILENMIPVTQEFLDQWKHNSTKVEVVRCKDCIHRPIAFINSEESHNMFFPDNRCPYSSINPCNSWYMHSEWFCGNGEKE